MSLNSEVSDIIIPPPVVCEIIHKTASFVAKHGRAFEEKISKSGQGAKTKFQFLDPTNPYNKYYENYIQDLIKNDQTSNDNGNAGNINKNSDSLSDSDISVVDKKKNVNNNGNSSSSNNNNNNNSLEERKTIDLNTSNVGKKPIVSLIAKKSLEVDTPAPKNRFEVNHPGTISTLLFDIIKLSAQYTAIAGKDFLPGLLAREANNVQFNFLQPGSLYFNYFTALVDGYSLALNPDESIRDRVKKYGTKNDNIHDGMQCLNECIVKYKEQQNIEVEENRNKNLIDNTDVNGLVIDWQDFVLVQTITFEKIDDDDDAERDNSNEYNANANLLGDQVAMVATNVPTLNKNNNNSEDENQNNGDEADNNMALVSDDEGEIETSVAGAQQQNFPSKPEKSDDAMSESDDAMSESDDNSNDDDNDNGIEVRTDYQPNISGRILPSLNVIDPKSGLAVPVRNIEEHMRVELMDPKWKEEQIRAAEKRKNTNVADGSSISQNLAVFATKKRQKIE
jgi:splicing factor 3A subunit 1